jgi:hypothetical protein
MNVASDLAILGIWNVVLTDTQIESLAVGLSAWRAIQPQGLWLFDQGDTPGPGTMLVNDHSGNGALQNTITGTTISYAASFPFTYSENPMEVLEV